MTELTIRFAPGLTNDDCARGLYIISTELRKGSTKGQLPDGSTWGFRSLVSRVNFPDIEHRITAEDCMSEAERIRRGYSDADAVMVMIIESSHLAHVGSAGFENVAHLRHALESYLKGMAR